MGGFIDLSNKKFGMLTVIERCGTAKDNQALWKCQCDCGNLHFARGRDLRNGHTKTCGCMSHELTNKAKTKHGKSESRIYGVWLSMKNRCYLSTCREYRNYGARGITVCDAWLGEHGAENFINWSYKNGYRDEKTQREQSLDRINVNGNYCPENCRWIDMKVQANNKRNNHFITHNGETHTIAEWSDITGIKRATIERRINQYGWSIEKSLTEKPRRSRRNRKQD